MNLQNSPLFELKNITLSYDGRPALHHVSGVIHRGEMLAISGPNGSGKSTLLRVLAGELSRFEGQLVSHLKIGERVAYLPQSSLVNTDIPVQVESIVSQGLWPQVSWGGFLRRAEKERVLAALDQVGMRDLASEVWAELSGGLRQRALIARLLCQNADVWLLDEPLNALDARSSREILELLRTMNAAGKTIVCVLHDSHVIHELFPRSCVLARELKFWGPTNAAISAADLRHGWVKEPAPCDGPEAELAKIGVRDV